MTSASSTVVETYRAMHPKSSALYDRAPRLADRLFHPQACVNKPSLYATLLMGFLEAMERATGIFDRRLGQMRVVLRRPAPAVSPTSSGPSHS